MRRLTIAAVAAAAVVTLAGPASAVGGQGYYAPGRAQSVAAHTAHRSHGMLWPVCWTNGQGSAHWKWRGDELVRHCYRR